MAGILHSGIYSGMVVASTEPSAPTGWLACDGTFKSQSTYADLFAAIGHTYGTDPGNGTFKLPDLNNGRAPIGASVYYPAGTNGGSNTHTHNFTTSLNARTTVSGAHSHSGSGEFYTVAAGSHAHNFNAAVTSGGAVGVVNTAKSGGTYATSTSGHTHSIGIPYGSNYAGSHSHSGLISNFNVDGAHIHNVTTNNAAVTVNGDTTPHHLVFYLIKT